MRLSLKGFSPDLDPATPGILTDCDGIVPTTQGMAAANSPVATSYPALATTPSAGFVAELLDGSKRTFVSSGTKIYEAIGGAWTDRSRAGSYTGTNRQRYAVFGNNVLATNRTQPIGQAAAGGAFTDIAGAPTALILVPASGFVVALNINGMTLGDVQDGWGCCALRNQADWTPSVATQCAAGRLLDSPGAIRAGAALGGNVVAYKNTSMYLGQYVGPPLVWAWTRVPGDIGCSGPESVVVVGTQHFFIGPSDIYVFDGSVPRPIGAPIREWFFADLSSTYRDRVIGITDLARDLVYWYYPSTASSDGAIDSLLTYNVRTEQWGKQRIAINAAVQYSSGQITYDAPGTLAGLSYDQLPSIAYDSPFWLADKTIPGVLIGDSLYSLTGDPGATWWQTCDVGDLTQYVFLSRMTPHFRVKPSAANGTNLYRQEAGDAPVQDATAPINRGRFDFRRSARWHRVRVDQVGPAVADGFDIAVAGDTSE